MNVIETTISKDYVSDWGLNEGIREIMQNALDANDKGFTGRLHYIKDKKKLIIYNRGVILNKASLLLGSTSKNNDINQRGNYGEGYKVGSLALCRINKQVTIYNGNETWIPYIDTHFEIDTPVLKFDILSGNPYEGRLTFEIKNINQEEWLELKKQFIPLCNLKEDSYHKTPQGKVLLEDSFKGKIYSGGIFVSHNKELDFGYDFKPSVLSLNRDRNMVDSFNLQWNTSKIWAYISANIEGKLYDVTSMLKANCPDVKYMDQFSDYTITGKLVEKFFEENSKKSYPVTTNEESEKVRSMGYRPIYSSVSYSDNLRKKLGTIEDLERKIELDWKLFKKITAIDDANIQWVFKVLHKIDHNFKFEMKIVKFAVDTTNSVHEKDKKNLIINCLLLKDRYKILREAIKFYSSIEKKSSSNIWMQLYKDTVEGIEIKEEE